MKGVMTSSSVNPTRCAAADAQRSAADASSTRCSAPGGMVLLPIVLLVHRDVSGRDLSGDNISIPGRRYCGVAVRRRITTREAA
jgi:hypothetical protein